MLSFLITDSCPHGFQYHLGAVQDLFPDQPKGEFETAMKNFEQVLQPTENYFTMMKCLQEGDNAKKMERFEKVIKGNFSEGHFSSIEGEEGNLGSMTQDLLAQYFTKALA